MIAFSYYNIKYAKHPVEKWVVAKGEIRNETNKNCSTAVFRIKLYVEDACIGAAIIKLSGFRAKSSKTFEVMIDGAHNKMIPKINRCEILFESAY
jgi:hypothetical protein